jgi:hypothetical protein
MRHFVGLSPGMVQIGIVETGGFYEVVADHSKERPAASTMPWRADKKLQLRPLCRRRTVIVEKLGNGGDKL